MLLLLVTVGEIAMALDQPGGRVGVKLQIPPALVRVVDRALLAFSVSVSGPRHEGLALRLSQQVGKLRKAHRPPAAVVMMDRWSRNGCKLEELT